MCVTVVCSIKHGLAGAVPTFRDGACEEPAAAASTAKTGENGVNRTTNNETNTYETSSRLLAWWLTRLRGYRVDTVFRTALARTSGDYSLPEPVHTPPDTPKAALFRY